jgi:hypothetical protein
MIKRIKKPPIKPEKRLEWLHRAEKEGETLTHIAEIDEVDIRTVRKHIDLARMERDVRQARSEVLRSALEGHYSDLMKTVRDIESQISSEHPVSVEKDQLLMMGLRQHMPRSPLWENMRKWNRTLLELSELKSKVQMDIQKLVEEDSRLGDIVSKGMKGVIPGAVVVLQHQFDQWARVREGLKLEQDIHFESIDGIKGNLRYGFSNFSEVGKEAIDDIKTVMYDLESELRKWPELFDMENLYNRLGRIKTSLQDVIAVILLRRIIPGRCKFCPL